MKIPTFLRFVGNLILNTRCQFYFDDIIVTLDTAALPLKASRKEQRSVICFLWAKDLRKCHSLWDASLQCMVTGVLRDQQYMFGVKSLLMVDEVLLMRNDLVAVLFRRPMQRSQQSHQAFEWYHFAILNHPEKPLTQISRSRYYSSSNNSKTVQDIFTMAD